MAAADDTDDAEIKLNESVAVEGAKSEVDTDKQVFRRTKILEAMAVKDARAVVGTLVLKVDDKG